VHGSDCWARAQSHIPRTWFSQYPHESPSWKDGVFLQSTGRRLLNVSTLVPRLPVDEINHTIFLALSSKFEYGLFYLQGARL